MRWPWISSVSPSMAEARPFRPGSQRSARPPSPPTHLEKERQNGDGDYADGQPEDELIQIRQHRSPRTFPVLQGAGGDRPGRRRALVRESMPSSWVPIVLD